MSRKLLGMNFLPWQNVKNRAWLMTVTQLGTWQGKGRRRHSLKSLQALKRLKCTSEQGLSYPGQGARKGRVACSHRDLFHYGTYPPRRPASLAPDNFPLRSQEKQRKRSKERTCRAEHTPAREQPPNLSGNGETP